MNRSLSRCALADLTIDIRWDRHGIIHNDRYFADRFNCWRDIFPGSPFEAIMDFGFHESATVQAGPGELVPDRNPGRVLRLPWSRLDASFPADRLKQGRFYPQGIITGQAGIFNGNRMPFRCIQIDHDGITADLNHPMAGIPMTVTLTVHNRSVESEERGGTCMDWMDLALTGPGMQTRHDNFPTDFLSGTPFDRRDPGPDPIFYSTDRFVQHIDDQARENLAGIYKTLLHPGDRVLDLMAGWESHLPADLKLASLHGIGLNANELSKNPWITGHTVQDLNINPVLGFNEQAFDAVICSLSVEYLTDPVAVFNEVARVLKPGGRFIVTFSNRWFPEKAIRIWEELHDFERMGLVTDYFLESGRYDALSTLSVRGYPRPYEDKYFPAFRLSDPVYAVTGETRDT